MDDRHRRGLGWALAGSALVLACLLGLLASRHRGNSASVPLAASELLRDVLNKPLEATFVVIEEVNPDNWGWGGLPVRDYRRQRAAARAALHRPGRDLP